MVGGLGGGGGGGGGGGEGGGEVDKWWYWSVIERRDSDEILGAMLRERTDRRVVSVSGCCVRSRSW